MIDETTRLALAARDGDRAAFARLVDRSQADVWRLCAHLVDRQVADDLTQDTFLRAAASITRFRGEASARTWLLTIARAACVDELRRRDRRRKLLARLQAQPRLTVTPSATGGVDLDLLLAALDTDRRTAFVLTQVLGLGYAEAAAVCGCPVGTIRSRVSRARSQIIDTMGGEDAFDVGN